MKAETPSIKLDAPKKPEINTDGLRSRPNALPDEQPSFGPEPVKFGKKIDVDLGGELRSASGGKELYNFGTSAAKHMTEPGRRVPIQIMDDVLKTTKGLPDPGGSRALMHYSPMWRNGTLYNLEILYDKASNSIWHFQYNPIKPWIYVQ